MSKVIKSTDTKIKTLYDFRFDMYFQHYQKTETNNHWLCYLINNSDELHIDLTELLYKGNLFVEFVKGNKHDETQIISITNCPKFNIGFKINSIDSLNVDDGCIVLNSRFLTTFLPLMEKLL